MTGLLELAAARRPVLLIIDAVDDMQDVVLGQRVNMANPSSAAGPQGAGSAVASQSVLDVLPHKQMLPARVHLVVSVRTDVASSDPEQEGDALRESAWTEGNESLASLEARGYTPMSLQPLTQAAARRATIAMLRRHGKRMESAQLDAISSRECSRLPLWLAVSTEELRVFGVYEKVLARIKALPDSLTLLFDQYLERLEIDHGKAVVSTVVTLLVASNEPGGGRLSEEELQGIMAFPPLVWTSLRLALRPYLAGSIASDGVGEELVAIAVGPLARAVRRRYWGHYRASALEPEYIPSAVQMEAGVGGDDREHGGSKEAGPTRFRLLEDDSAELAEREDDGAASVGLSSIGEVGHQDDRYGGGKAQPSGLAGRSVVSSATRSLPGRIGQLGRLLVNSAPYPRAVHLFLAGFMLQRALGHGVAESAMNATLPDLTSTLKAVVSPSATMRAAAEARARTVHEASIAVENKEKSMAAKHRWGDETGVDGRKKKPEPGSHEAKVAEARALLEGKAGESSESESSDSDDSIDWFFSAKLKTAKEGEQGSTVAAAQQSPARTRRASISNQGEPGAGLSAGSQLLMNPQDNGG